jgi:hypothetical protein
VRRWLITTVIFLLAGAVVNVAVAWACAAWSAVDNVPLPDPPMPINLEAGDVVEHSALCGRGLEITIAHCLEGDYYVDLDIVAGWPCLALQQRRWHSYQALSWESYELVAEFLEALISSGADSWSDGELRELNLSLEEGKTPAEASRREQLLADAAYGLDLILDDAVTRTQTTPRTVLLRRPVWPGFGINTLLYAAILWLLVCGPFSLRRYLRRRRGLCPACAYPMGEAVVCTECGRPLPGRAVV